MGQKREKKKISFHTCTRVLVYNDSPYPDWPPIEPTLTQMALGGFPKSNLPSMINILF